jgi:hypothetical protein
MQTYLYNDFIINLSEKFNRRLEEIESDFNFELGDEFEYAICDILQDLLPDNFGVTRGFVVNKDGSKKGDDIIIYDRNRFPTLRFHNKGQFHRLENIPIEAVYAYIEAKHTIEYKTQDEKCSFTKAFRQASEAKELISQREASDIFSFNPYFKNIPLINNNLKPSSLPKINNPAFSCIIARNFKYVGDKIQKVDINSLDFLINNVLIPKQAFIPDLIVLNKDIVFYPRIFENGEFKEGALFNHNADNHSYQILIRPNIAYGIFLSHLLFAIDWIKLGKMPWDLIHFDATKPI